MLTDLNPSAQRFLSDLNRIQANTNTAQQQVTSGLKVQTASDAPDRIGDLLQLEAQKSANTQTLSNLGRVGTEVTAADNALTTAVQLLDKITQLAGQGLSANTAQQRSIFAQQIQGFQQQLISLTGTTVEGRYIFDGGDGSGPPYQADPTATNGAVQLRNTPATRQVADSSGTVFAYAQSAQQIFDYQDALGNPLPGNILTAIGNAITALNANDSTATSTAIDGLHTAANYLGTQQTFYGGVENRLTSGNDGAQALDVSLKTQISAIRDTDFIEASLAITRGNTEQQAALAAEAKAQSKSLFDYLA